MPLRDAKFVKEYLSLSSEQRVYECARLGLIPSVKIGRQVRFDEDTLREWVRRGGSITQKDRERGLNLAG
jgi:excisionase family DNA binding protein